MVAKSLLAAVLLIAACGAVQAQSASPAKPLDIAEAMVEQDLTSHSNAKAQAAKARMSEIVKEMSAPGIDQLTRENLRIQYQAAVREYRAALSRPN
jgi:ABC-type glycerol-3-phosphate transport system substrate-binding protein